MARCGSRSKCRPEPPPEGRLELEPAAEPEPVPEPGAMRTAAAALALSALLTFGTALPTDELGSLKTENLALRAELLALREQNSTPVSAPPAKQNLAGSKPNVVILFGDDIGHGDLGVFGHPTSRTPWLDQMAAEGAKLTMYESGANVCSPSRASIMTGRYYTRTGAYPGVFSPNSVGGLPLNETTIAKALIPAGYASGMVGKWHLGVGEYMPTNHGFDFYYGAPMTQNECTSNIKYPGSSVYHPPDTSAAMDSNESGESVSVAEQLTAGEALYLNCTTPYVVYGIGLSTGGVTHHGAHTVEACCAVCTAAGDACGAWTFHNASKSTGCVTSATALPHISAGTMDATSGSKKPIPPKPWPKPSGGGGASGFGPCPIFNGSTGAVTEQYDLLTTPPHLYDMLGIDDKYDAAFEGFVRKAHAKSQPFFFYFCSHHTHAPQFAPDDFRGYSVRGLQGDSLGLIDRSAGRMMNLTKTLGIDDSTIIIMSADNGGSLVWRELGGVNGDLRCGKGTTYEGGHRVPLIARWPGKIAAGVVISELTSSLDWFPTIMNLAGVSLPTDRKIDGVDMHDVLFAQGPMPRTKRTDFLYFEWRSATLMAVRINQWKLHVQVRGSHCSAPFPDSNCYNAGFENATGVAAMDPSTCPAVGQLDIVPASGCVPMLVNLDTDPGEAQLRTLICEPETTAPGPMKGQLEPRCHTQEEIQPILTALWQLYNVSNCRGEDGCDLWGASEIGRGGNAAERFPCCDPGCSPKPYCCKCAPGETGPEPPTTEQHIVGFDDPMYPQFPQW